MIKKKLFIGSSSEELDIANAVKSVLENDFDITIWDETVWDTSIFKLNQNFLSDLLKASLQFDFGILIGSTDDKVIVRGEEKLQPRDNVIFELGLFTGRLGTSKCAFLIDKNIKLPSDFNGITLARFDRLNPNSLITETKKIKDLFMSTDDDEINFFPSATLAAVYYENLVNPICRYVIENGGIEVDGKKYAECILNIIVPDTINNDVNLQFQKIKSRFTMKDISINCAGRPRNITIDAQVDGNILNVIDFPTIISGINHAISNLLPQDFNKFTPDYNSILSRELRRFMTTLKKLLIRGGFDEMVVVKKDL